jgi:hypothetical protein
VKVKNSAPKPTPAAYAEFERQSKLQVPNAVRWFLENVVNGGWPEEEPELPINGLRGYERFIVHGLYGIGHPDDGYDMFRAIGWNSRKRLMHMWPIAFDPLGSKLYFIHSGPHAGQIRCMPVEYATDHDSEDSWFVVKDIVEMARMLQSQP